MAARIDMTANTTTSSTRENPRWDAWCLDDRPAMAGDRRFW
jgi:hypothetical protein